MNSNNMRDIYLPEGKWVNFFSGEITDGSVWLKNFEAPLSEMPVWVRFGAKIPFYPDSVSCTDEMDLSRAVAISFDDTYEGLDKSMVGKVVG
jgi:alpha-D-xyloside xylohydrolase